MIFYHWSINYVASKFHRHQNHDFPTDNGLMKLHQCTRAESFRLTSNMHGSWSDNFINLKKVLKPCYYKQQLLEGKCACWMKWRRECRYVFFTFIFEWQWTINWVWLEVPESLTNRSYRASTRRVIVYTYHDDNRWALVYSGMHRWQGKVVDDFFIKNLGVFFSK